MRVSTFWVKISQNRLQWIFKGDTNSFSVSASALTPLKQSMVNPADEQIAKSWYNLPLLSTKNCRSQSLSPSVSVSVSSYLQLETFCILRQLLSGISLGCTGDGCSGLSIQQAGPSCDISMASVQRFDLLKISSTINKNKNCPFANEQKKNRFKKSFFQNKIYEIYENFKNQWNLLPLVIILFFQSILYYPCFYSSLSDK